MQVLNIYERTLISGNYKWSDHIDQISKKANRTLGFVRRNTYGCSQHFKEAAYISLVRPHLEYSSSVWDPHTKSDITKLDRVQRRAARFVTGDYRYTSSVSCMLERLGWDSLSDRRKIGRLSMIRKILNSEVDIPVDAFFEARTTITRKSHSQQLKRYQPRGDIDKFAFAQRTIPEWNALPCDIINSDSSDSFKRLLSTHIASTSRYD